MHRQVHGGTKAKLPKTYLSLRIAAGSTDLDTLEHAQRIAGGTIAGPYKADHPRHKPYWTWGISRKNEVVVLVRALRPLMSARRQRQIDALLVAFAAKTEVPYEERTHCPQDHPYAGDNLYITPDGVRQCRACRREVQRRRRARSH